MNYKVLYRKYRPSNFDELVGQTKTKELLRESIINDKIAHAYIFSGPRGTGKTSSAKIFAKSVNCLNPQNGNPCGECVNCLNSANSSDIYEIDAASNNGVDQVREIIENIKLSPIESKYKVYIIDEVHMLSQSAFNALLLTLEEPPSHVIFILATTDIEDVPITVLSRCQRLEFRKISNADIESNLKNISKLENIQISDEAIHEIAVYADGGMRDALSILDQMSKENKPIEVQDILDNIGLISTQNIIKLLDMLENNDTSGIESFIDDCNTNAYDLKTLIKKIINEIKNREVLIKNGDFRTRLSYSLYKKLAFELSDLLWKNNINMDAFVLLELILMDYIQSPINAGESETQASQKIIKKPEEKSVENLLKKEEKKAAEKVLEKHEEPVKKIQEPEEPIINKTSNNDYINKLMEVRVNNCFVGPNKDLKTKISAEWKNYLLHETSRKIKGMLSDTEVAAVSDKVIILEHPYEDNAIIINENIETVENLFNTYLNSSYKIIAISVKYWMKSVENYKDSLKKNIKYVYKDEPSKDDNIELNDVFLNDKIEIK